MGAWVRNGRMGSNCGYVHGSLEWVAYQIDTIGERKHTRLNMHDLKNMQSIFGLYKVFVPHLF